MCDTINWAIKKIIYFSFIQSNIGPAGYFRDNNNVSSYMKNAVFLPKVNNEVNASATQKTNFEQLDSALLIMFGKDTMIHPKETAQFGELDTKGKLVNYKDTDLYKNDLIGLKALDDAGKLHFLTYPGNHLEFSMADIDRDIVPILKQ
jgi:palmitoyl-protein thioesterase